MRGRRAVHAYFALTGFAHATWAVHLPAVKRALGLDAGTLGLVLLGLAVSCLVGTKAAGPIVERFGSRPVARVGGSLASLLLVAVGLTPTIPALAITAAAIGFATGPLLVAANAQAVAVEKRYGRPIMSLFHAFYSVGGVSGSLVGYLLVHAGVPHQSSLICCGLALEAGYVIAGRQLLIAFDERSVTDGPAGPAPADAGAAPADGGAARSAWLLGLVAAACLIGEGAALDWSAVHLQGLFARPTGVAALGYAAYASTMTVGRLCGDRLVARLGPAAILRYGGAVAALGFLLIGVLSTPTLVIVGWALAGTGLCCIVPQVFSAAGNLEHPARSLSVAATLGNIGLLAGPPLIGFAAGAVGLGHALLIPGVLAVGVSVGAKVIRHRG